MPQLAVWLRRRQTGAAALLLYTLLAVAMMAPLAPDVLPFTGAQDIGNHVSGIIEAKNALAEGQFPIRVAPHQNHSERYAIYQFYGNLPYTVGGLLYLATDASPYTVWKSVVTACVALGGFFTYRLGRTLTRQALAGLAAGVVFATAPYLLTDIHGRVAYPEIVSFTLLPAVFYYAWRSFAGRGWGAVLASGVLWCCLALSHNITFLYGSLFLGLFFLSFLGPLRRLPRRWLRVGASYGLGLVLSAWYVAPQQALLPHMCEGLAPPVGHGAWLTPLGVLLAPSVALPDHLGTIYIACQEHFGLQIGWPILVAAGLALYAVRVPAARLGGKRAVLVRLLALFLLAAVMVWTPFDFWAALPTLFSYVQFSYRLLMFVVLFGSVLAAYALALTLEGRMRPIHLALTVLAAGFSAAPYLGPHRPEPALSLDKEIAEPNIGRGGACAFFRPGAQCLLATSEVHADVNWAGAETGGLLDSLQHLREGTVWAVLPAPAAGDALRLEGAAVAPVRLTVAVDDVVLATPQLAAGPFQWTLPLPPGKDRVRVMVHGDPIVEMWPPPHSQPKKTPSYALARLTMERSPAVRDGRKLIRAGQVHAQMAWGQPSVLKLHLAEPSLVQLPVAYYPDLLRVEHNGRRVPVRHLGRFVALELPPGAHEIRVRFVGVRWANVVSLAAWAGVALAALAIVGVRLVGTRSRPRRLFAIHRAREAMMRLIRKTGAPLSRC